ncbi:MAG: hypothetical protein H7A55_06305 [Verrucomicrobiaceae bacterium]|nr:hypothetical protein [Verrucomicrobiaceae bacterium]
MSEPNQFRHYRIVQDSDGNNVELVRSAEQVVVLAFDTVRMDFVHCHVLLQPLTQRAAFEDGCRKLQRDGHPLLARIVDFGEDDGNPFYITSNVDGEPLRSYLNRQQDIPGWMAVMLACRALEASCAICERGDFYPDNPLDVLRVVQVGPQSLVAMVADYKVVLGTSGNTGKSRTLKSAFDKQGKFLRTFLLEQAGGGPMLPDHPLPAADFAELLGACLIAASPSSITQMQELRNSLSKLAPDHLSGEIPTAQKPRALIAPLLASYQEVARGVVNLVRIQSQRLDMSNPYSMRGTLTKAGRPVLVEQVPPQRVCGERVLDADKQTLKIAKKREFGSLVSLALVNETDEITCLAEEVVEGISLADVLRERRALEVQEAYLVLAGLDSALMQLDASQLPVRKLRLEDIFLMTGFGREDPRTARLLESKLNEWPAFSVMLRTHPCLAGMSCRGTDPSVLLPPPPGVTNLWHGGWMAAAGKFLLGIESPAGVRIDEVASGRERETVVRLLEDEIDKARNGSPVARSDFLSRYARIVHHYDLVKPTPVPLVTEISPPRTPKGGRKKAEPTPIPPPESVRVPAGGALTSGLSAVTEKPTIGFAELLFQGGGDARPPDEPDWAQRGMGADGVLPDDLDLGGTDNVPMWLKAAVFLGASMLCGAVAAHFSGHALWQKLRGTETGVPGKVPVVVAPPVAAPPKAVVVDDDDKPGVEIPPVVVPTGVPDAAGTSGGEALTLRPPPASQLKELFDAQK